MKIADFIKINTETLKMLSKNGVYIDDYQYMELYDDYTDMLNNKEKKEYIHEVLKRKYNVSKRTQQRIIKRLSAIC